MREVEEHMIRVFFGIITNRMILKVVFWHYAISEGKSRAYEYSVSVSRCLQRGEQPPEGFSNPSSGESLHYSPQAMYDRCPISAIRMGAVSIVIILSESLNSLFRQLVQLVLANNGSFIYVAYLGILRNRNVAVPL